jgi:hypothetical protein
MLLPVSEIIKSFQHEVSSVSEGLPIFKDKNFFSFYLSVTSSIYTIEDSINLDIKNKYDGED